MPLISAHPSPFEIMHHTMINQLPRSIHKANMLSSMWLQISLKMGKIVHFWVDPCNKCLNGLLKLNLCPPKMTYLSTLSTNCYRIWYIVRTKRPQTCAKPQSFAIDNILDGMKISQRFMLVTGNIQASEATGPLGILTGPVFVLIAAHAPIMTYLSTLITILNDYGTLFVLNAPYVGNQHMWAHYSMWAHY